MDGSRPQPLAPRSLGSPSHLEDRSTGRILQSDDPLYSFLTDRVLGEKLGLLDRAPTFEIRRLGEDRGVHWVFLYTERTLGVRLVCKFYGTKPLFAGWIGDRKLRTTLLLREFESLTAARALGLDRGPHQIVRPLATSREINCVLVEEYVAGTDLAGHATMALLGDNRDALYERLEEVAALLFKLHRSSREQDRSDGIHAGRRLVDLVAQLKARATLSQWEAWEWRRLANWWAASGLLDAGSLVPTYGDPGLNHFILDGKGNVVGIDLEELNHGDAAQDLGRVLAELTHFFAKYSVSEDWVDPYLDCFLDAYARICEFKSIEVERLRERCRFYHAYYLANIGLNHRLDLSYRREMIDRARDLLQSGPV